MDRIARCRIILQDIAFVPVSTVCFKDLNVIDGKGGFLGFITSLCVFQYSLFYVDEGSGDGPDEGYRFGNTLEHFDLHLLFM